VYESQDNSVHSEAHTEVQAEATRPSERRRGFSVQEQLRFVVPLVVVWAFGFACLAAVALSGDVGELLLDPTWIGGAAWYAGVVSQFGAIAWTTAAVAAIFGGWIAKIGGRSDASKFLFVGAFATFALLADDLFGFHAVLLPQQGVPKLIAMLIVVAPAGLWVLRFRRDIARTRYQVLVASVLANVVSGVIDQALRPGRYDFAVLFEDGAKFLGALAWATYFGMTSRDIARSVLQMATSRNETTHRRPERPTERTAEEPTEELTAGELTTVELTTV
jgi:hypothetical protein